MRRRRLLWVSLTVTTVVAAVTAIAVVASWPDVGALASRNPASTAFIDRYRAARRGEGQPDAVQQQWVPWQAISPHLKRAVVSAEDMEFFGHQGFSTTEIRAALRQAWEEREAPRGASTITQQLAKNLWLSPSRSPLRKLREVMLTRQIEAQLTKTRILELYLNVVEFGPGVYGAEAAARHYFGKPASALTQREAAQLAGGLPRPRSWHPGVESESYRRYVAEIERRMDRAEFIWRHIGGQPPQRVVSDTGAALDSVTVARDSAGGAP